MSEEGGPLLPRIGELADAHAAIDLALMSDGSGVTDLKRYRDISEGELVGVISSLSNLCAVLARMASAYQSRAATGRVTSASELLGLIREAQEIRAARDELGLLDDGLPFDEP